MNDYEMQFLPRSICFLFNGYDRYTPVKTIKMPNGKEYKYTRAFSRGLDESCEYASLRHGGAQEVLVLSDPNLMKQFKRASMFSDPAFVELHDGPEELVEAAEVADNNTVLAFPQAQPVEPQAPMVPMPRVPAA